ncbi:MAG: hypothetical protein KF832_06180 [Caldilineaceae bacterium]|nr:hypothetical protein [Caldilineaceae bacterium]
MNHRIWQRVLIGLLALGTVAACVVTPIAPSPTVAPTAPAAALTWHREGGIAGFCDDLTISPTGEVTIYSCRSEPPTVVASAQLDAAQAATVADWIAGLQSFQYAHRDAALADGMTVQLNFTGSGTQVATATEQDAIVEFAQALHTEVVMAASAPTATPEEAAPIQETGAATVEAIEIQLLEPTNELQAVIRGYLPDACAFIESTGVYLEGNTFRIQMTTAWQPNQRCAQMLTPFEEVVPLGVPGLPAGAYAVRINDLVQSFTLSADNGLTID